MTKGSAELVRADLEDRTASHVAVETSEPAVMDMLAIAGADLEKEDGDSKRSDRGPPPRSP